MSPRYLSLGILRTALKQSSKLIASASHLRVAGFASAAPAIGTVKVVAIDSSLCSGRNQGLTAHGILIGIPV